MYLKALYNACIRHGYVPISFKTGMIIPVSKVKVTSVMSCEQFRPIKIVPILFKVLECCIINCCNESLITHSNQFAYKKGGGYEKVVFYVNLVINYFMQHNSKVFVNTLDASAAFDRINIYGMLSKLMKLNVNFSIVRILLSWYTKFGAQVKWAGELSRFFEIRSDERQGGLASAFLFTVYVDDLLNELNECRLGCFLGDMWLGAIMYADDLILISGSVIQMHNMLKKCAVFGTNMDLTFNAIKSFYYCTDHNIRIEFKINNSVILFAGSNFNHLGAELGVKQKLLCIIPDKRIKKFINASMSVCRNTEHLPLSARNEQIQRKCVPILMYALGSGMMTKNDMHRLRISYRNEYRYVFKVRRFSPIFDTLFFCGADLLEFLVDGAFLILFKKIFEENNKNIYLHICHKGHVSQVQGNYNVSHEWSCSKISYCIRLYDNQRILHNV